MKPTKTDLKRLDAMTDEDIRKAVEADPDAAPLADRYLQGEEVEFQPAAADLSLRAARHR